MTNLIKHLLMKFKVVVQYVQIIPVLWFPMWLTLHMVVILYITKLCSNYPCVRDGNVVGKAFEHLYSWSKTPLFWSIKLQWNLILVSKKLQNLFKTAQFNFLCNIKISKLYYFSTYVIENLFKTYVYFSDS